MEDLEYRGDDRDSNRLSGQSSAAPGLVQRARRLFGRGTPENQTPKQPARQTSVAAQGNGTAEPEADSEKQRCEAWAICEELARSPRILDRMAEELRSGGLVGEERAAKLIYLVLVSRFLERPLCAVIKGPSSAGKNFVTGSVLSLFPSAAAYRLTGMSPHALVYGNEPLSHRVLVLEEAAGLTGGATAYFMRSLISEGRLRYETVERAKDGGLKPRVIEREGPTGLLVTTTALSIEPELETRLFSIPITDTSEQTGAVLRALAARDTGGGAEREIDVAQWLALQTWINYGEHRVVIPYADELARAIPPVAVRLRRDFGSVLGLIKAHAVLHQAGRGKDTEGRVVAIADDYAAVHELVADLVSAGVGASVPQTVRETVEAVKALAKSWIGGVPQSAVKKELDLDKATVSRRIKHAIELGYLVDEQDKRGQPAQLKLGDPMPDELEVLPRPEAFGVECCSVAPFLEGSGLGQLSTSPTGLMECDPVMIAAD
jgi:hypothetical protein